MKLKYYLRGLGLGIVLTTLILTVSFHFKSEMKDSDIIDRAKELGMVMQDATKDTLFAETTTDSKANPETTKPTDDNQTTEATTEVPTTEVPTTEAPTTEAPTKEAPTAPPEPAVKAQITITPGSSSSSVANSLADAGIIKNRTEFDKYLEDNGFSEQIQVGTFNVNSSMSYYDIATIITR